MAQDLEGKRIAILAADGVETSELVEPRRALEDAGANVELLSGGPGSINGTDGTAFSVDREVAGASVSDFDGLLLPGGVANPDKLRMNKEAVAFVKAFVECGKPVAAICHAPWMLVEADVVEGLRVTSYPSLQADLENAGAIWRDEEVVVDRNLVTSRMPKDIPEFNREMLRAFAQQPALH